MANLRIPLFIIDVGYDAHGAHDAHDRA
jgi:hypothetical protein